MSSSDGRFAPSPTGTLHLGNLRTALLAWLFARSAGARFLVRMEDLDTGRVRPGAAEQQLADLAAIGLDWDGEVVFQSQRLERYADAIEALGDRVYECYCTRAEIRAAASAPHGPLPEGAYPGTCLRLTAAELAEKHASGRPPALRVRADAALLGFEDRLHGWTEGVVDDFVVRRNDGAPAYNLAVVVDDAEQGIGEVVRGDDLLDSTPRQLFLARALGLPEPSYAHVPLVLGPDGQRLAKRHGDVTLREVEPDAARAWMLRSLGLALGRRFRPRRSPPRADTATRGVRPPLDSGAMFVGRERERARIDRLLEDARAGRSGALLLHGEAGIGKTALMRWAIGRATGMRVLRARGIETDSDIAFAGLAELVTPLVELLDAIPEVQARALRGALALGPATPHDRFTVPAGLLSLLAAAAEERPLLVAIDDAQWLDEASLEAFLFAGRRVGAEGIAMLGSLRDGTAVAGMEVPWLERLRVAPLPDGEARELLGDERLAPSVADRLVSTAAGNPLALLEIPRLLSDGQRAGREPLDEPLRPGTGVERAFRRALDALDDRPRRALLVAAAAHTGRLDAIAPALEQAELTVEDLGPAEEARLISIRRGRARLPPSAPALDRLSRRRARSSVGPRMWRTPRRRVRAVPSARGTWPRSRSRRTRKWRRRSRRPRSMPAGAARTPRRRATSAARRSSPRTTSRARGGCWRPRPTPRAPARPTARGRCSPTRRGMATDPLLAADIQRMTGHVEMRRGSPLVAYELLVAEAERVRSRDPRRAAGMFLEASVTHMMTGDMHALVATAERARALATSSDPAVELLATAVIGEAYLALGDVEQGDALLSACEPYLLEGDPLAIVEVVGMAAHASIWIEKFDRAERILERLIAAARDASAVSAMIYPLAARAHLDFRLGRWAAARAGAAESVELAQDTGQLPLLSYSLAALACTEAALGQEDECRRHVKEGMALVARFQGDATGTYLNAALGLLELGLGRIPEAIAVLEEAQGTAERLGQQPAVVMFTPDLIEAYARAGRREEAAALLDGFEARGRGARSRWAEAATGRLRGLLAPDDAMRAQFEAALALHDDLPMPFERARTLLCFGERLRRARARADAREPLKEALEIFERLGARGWAERTRTELRATGEQQSRRSETAAEQLTPHELQIAVLVAQGMTNREAAAALFLSPKTIEYHLGQIYRKLDVRGRAQLARLMAMEGAEGARDRSPLAEALP